MAAPTRLPLTFEDVAIYFLEEEWQDLEVWQKELYNDVMKTNYETFVSLGGALPKPELISWIEQGREPCRSWGESQHPGNVALSSADLHFDPIMEGHLFGVSGNLQTVKPRETKCHLQLGLLQSQSSSGSEFLGESPDPGLVSMKQKRQNTHVQAAVTNDSAQREGIPNHSALVLPGLGEAPSWKSTQHPCPACGESFWEKNHLVRHQKCHSKDRSPRDRAWQKFNKRAEAQPLQGTQGRFQCLECGQRFRLKRCLRRHMGTHMRKNPCQCPPCKLCAQQEQIRPGHKEENPSHSRKCGEDLAIQCALAEHTQLHAREPPFPCAQCGRSFRQQRQLQRHQQRHTEEKPFQCPQCTLSFRLQRALRAHAREHYGEQPFSCSECGRGFAHHCRLLEHLRVHSGERPFVCPECGKRFRLKGLLTMHQRTHSTRRPFSCPQCAKGFAHPSKLTEHLRVHSGERPFRCLECDRGFRLKGQLLSHQRLHTGERPFQCPECDKCYRVKADMKAHQLLHRGEMPFSCACGKGFAKQSKLTEHIRTHTGEKPFQCPTCNKRFRLKAQLLSHQGLHTGERPFRCPECDKNFRERGHMRRHQRIHRPERPFACDDCGKGFIYKSKLAEHIRVHAKACRAPSESDVKKRLSQLLAMIEADWS
ncbi:zinc finger protein 786 [Cavia porcellus]|uniref:Zinc finger protein 786 n=1 Tax=Cavia porcellus TaxID=10141 RepID=A0A286XDL1_CAVPO|nr:zinc finger protein 786 [Cavia porcellus]